MFSKEELLIINSCVLFRKKHLTMLHHDTFGDREKVKQLMYAIQELEEIEKKLEIEIYGED